VRIDGYAVAERLAPELDEHGKAGIARTVANLVARACACAADRQTMLLSSPFRPPARSCAKRPALCSPNRSMLSPDIALEPPRSYNVVLPVWHSTYARASLHQKVCLAPINC
jgi:hypothetical protein